jgi:hypothetical protein
LRGSDAAKYREYGIARGMTKPVIDTLERIEVE